MQRMTLFLAALLTLSGCATEGKSGKSARPGAGLAEYSQLVAHSRAAVDSVLRSLEEVRRQSAPCPPKVVAAFSAQVDQLAVQSVQVRARSQAMQARGDAYFENWHANLERISDPATRQRVEEHRADLQQGLATVKQLSQQTREAFQSFLTGLRSLRGIVESHAEAVQADATQDLARRTAQSGLQVEQGLDAIAEQLRAMSLMLVASSSAKTRE
jgi:hypothetical protein